MNGPVARLDMARCDRVDVRPGETVTVWLFPTPDGGLASSSRIVELRVLPDGTGQVFTTRGVRDIELLTFDDWTEM